MSWVEQDDAARHQAMWDDEQRQQRQRDAAQAAIDAAVIEKRKREGWRLGDIDFDAPSLVEQQYAADVGRMARWQQYRATTQAAESGWVRYEQPPQWFR